MPEWNVRYLSETIMTRNVSQKQLYIDVYLFWVIFELQDIFVEMLQLWEMKKFSLNSSVFK